MSPPRLSKLITLIIQCTLLPLRPLVRQGPRQMFPYTLQTLSVSFITNIPHDIFHCIHLKLHRCVAKINTVGILSHPLRSKGVTSRVTMQPSTTFIKVKVSPLESQCNPPLHPSK